MALTIGKLGGYAVYMIGPNAIGQRVRVAGKYCFFDFDERFGPLVVDKDGEPADAQPIGEDHPFWKPFEAWLAGYWQAKAAGELSRYLMVNDGTRPAQPLSYPGRSSIQRSTAPADARERSDTGHTHVSKGGPQFLSKRGDT